MRQMDLEAAALVARDKSDNLNRAAVRWTIGAVTLGTAASLASLFPL